MFIEIQNRQRGVKVPMEWLRRFADAALPECALHSADAGFALKKLAEIEVAIVSDRIIARVHEEFMGISGPTDVITFDHGEIVISADTAKAQAAEYRQPVEIEIALYIVHGLLHLNGYEDARKRDAMRMQKAQERIMRACLARISAH